MTKEELMIITLKQLKDSAKHSPECLSLEDPELGHSGHSGISIMWKFRVEVDGNTIQDPNNAARTVIISYNKFHKQMIAQIFFREIYNANTAIMPDAIVIVKYKRWPFLYKSYRDFRSLRKLILKSHFGRQSINYLKKLNSIFPSALDDHLF